MLKNLWNSAKSICQKSAAAVKGAALAVVGSIVGLAASAKPAFAVLPSAVGTTVTEIQTNGQAIFDLVFPVIGLFVGLVVVIKLFKRFSNKANVFNMQAVSRSGAA